MQESFEEQHIYNKIQPLFIIEICVARMQIKYQARNMWIVL
jgi:hypothetical protein